MKRRSAPACEFERTSSAQAAVNTSNELLAALPSMLLTFLTATLSETNALQPLLTFRAFAS